MASITPEQARAELERRRMARASPGVSPDAARAELERRRAAQVQGPQQSDPIADLMPQQTVDNRPRAPAQPPEFDESRGAGMMTRVAAGMKPNDDAKANYLRERFGADNVHVAERNGEKTIYLREKPGGKFHPLDPKGLDVGDVADIWGDAIPVAASALGGAAGSVAGPAGTMAGMAGGAWLGNLARQGMSAALPGKENVAPLDRLKSANQEAQLAVVGQGAGVALGKAGGAAARSVSDSLTSLGRSRLFKAAVGQNKRAFTQMNGKGLFEKAGKYLDEMGIGWGDSTESIGKKLTERRDAIGAQLDGMVQALDEATAGAPLGRISPRQVATRIEKEVLPDIDPVSAPNIVAEVKGYAKRLRKTGNAGMPFSEARRMRKKLQDITDYRADPKPLAEARQKMSRIWNDVIDEHAEPLLKASGKAGDAYREMRHEFALAEELLGHVRSRMDGNASIRALSPSDTAMGGISSIMTSNPFIGIAAAAANHIGRVYGNAAAGRSAINVARMATSGNKGAELALPHAIRSMMPSAGRSATATGAPMFQPLPPAAVASNEEDEDITGGALR